MATPHNENRQPILGSCKSLVLGEIITDPTWIHRFRPHLSLALQSTHEIQTSVTKIQRQTIQLRQLQRSSHLIPVNILRRGEKSADR